MARVRAGKERHRQRPRVYRIAVALAGIVLVVLGLLLSLPGVPGPGLLVVALGLTLLALEFDRAERMLERILNRLEQVGETASKASGLQKTLTGAIVLVAVGTAIAVVVFLDVPFLSFA